MILQEGQLVGGKYRILARLGQGGMATVFRACDEESHTEVALKQLVPQPGPDAELRARMREQFAQEASTLARLSHPNLVRVIDTFEADGDAFLAMDYIEGDSLAEYIARYGALVESQVIVWAHQLLDALVYCHAQGVIHRDIKPQNIIIRPDGNAVLADFGLAKQWDPLDSGTGAHLRGMGTREYAPPEQWGVHGAGTDPRSDLYSLGATLFHALTGQAPPTAAERQTQPSSFRHPRALAHRISPRMEALVLRAMSLQVERRFSSAEAMRAALMATSDDLATPPLPARARPPAEGDGRG